MSSPQQIQEEIERTRSELSGDVNRLTEKVSPARVVNRRLDSVKSGASSLRDRVMGSSAEGSGVRGAAGSMSSAASDAKETITSAPQVAKARTQGSPLAAGLVAFGVGMVVSALVPPTQAEQHLASEAETKAKEQLAGPAKEAGQQLVDEMKPVVEEAADQVKSTTQEAKSTVAGEARSAAEDVKAPMQR
jgi:hypothetical protein